MPEAAKLMQAAARKSRFKPQSVHLTLRGLCPDCLGPSKHCGFPPFLIGKFNFFGGYMTAATAVAAEKAMVGQPAPDFEMASTKNIEKLNEPVRSPITVASGW
jgi:hypothetical protein